MLLSASRRKKRPKTTSKPSRCRLEGELLIFCHLLGFTTSHRVSTLPGTYQHVTLVYPGQPEPARTRPSAPARICLYPRRIQRMLPGYRGKAEATYSAKFFPGVKCIPDLRAREMFTLLLQVTFLFLSRPFTSWIGLICVCDWFLGKWNCFEKFGKVFILLVELRSPWVAFIQWASFKREDGDLLSLGFRDIRAS